MDRKRFLGHEAALHPWLWVGDWHSHDELVAHPSEPDERGWAAFVRAHVGLYVGVIATPRDLEDCWRWSNAIIRAWVNRVEDGVPRCEPATLTTIEDSGVAL